MKAHIISQAAGKLALFIGGGTLILGILLAVFMAINNFISIFL